MINTNSQMVLKNGTIPKGYNLYNNHCTFISPFYTFPWRETIIVYTSDQGTNREKYFNHNIYQRERCRLGREIKTPFRPFLRSRTASFPSFDRKKYGPIRRKWTSKWLLPRQHNKKKKQRSKSFPYRELIQ